MKKLLLMLLGVLLALPAFAADGDDFEFTYEGQTLTYTVISEADKTVRTKEGKYSVYGNYVSGNLALPEKVQYNGAEYTLIEIGKYAFNGCWRLTSVTIPNSVTSIGNSAFRDCTGLTSVTIPNSVTTIDSDAFRRCTGLKSITIPNSVTTIGYAAFYGCTYLESVTIPNSVTSIGEWAFYGCSGLTSVSIPNSVTSIGEYTFNGCISLTSVTIGNSVTKIGYSAFYGCTGLKSITIPPSVTSIGSDAFRGCTGLIKSAYPSTISNPFPKGVCIQYPAEGAIVEDVFVWGPDKSAIYFAPFDLKGEFEIPGSVISIGTSAFRRCTGLKSITIPNSVTTIDSDAFRDCTGLTSIELKSVTPPNFYSIFASYKDQATLIIPDGTFYDYLKTSWQYFLSIKDMSGTELDSFNDQVFTYRYIPASGEAVLVYNNYSSMASASIPDRIYVDEGEAQGFYKVTGIAANAFSNCANLKQLKISANCTFIGNNAFSRCSGLTSVTIPDAVTTIGNSAFKECPGLTNVTIPDAVTTVGNSAFEGCSGMESVEISNSVTKIGDSAFQDCAVLTSVTIPNAVTTIGNSAFQGCKGMTSVIIGSAVESIGDSAFRDCTGLTSVTIGNSVESIGDSAFSGCTRLTSVEIPNSVTTIGSSAFSDCTGLTSVIIGSAVTTIGNNAFYGCTGLTSVIIGSAVESIGEYAFRGCTGLTSVTIGNSVTTIGNNAFRDCTGLTKVEINDLAAWCNINFGNESANPLCYAKHLYLDGSEITDFVVPNSVTSIDNYAFYGCTGLTSVIIGSAVESIGDSAFDGCTGLKSVTIPNSVTSIGKWAFSRCTGLTYVSIPYSVISISESAFSGASKIVSLTFEDGVKELSVEAFAFSGMNPTSVYLGRGYNVNIPVPTNLTIGGFVTSLPENAYKGKKTLQTLTINNGLLQTIGASAFQDCSNLKEVTFPVNYVEIGENAFASTGLTELTFPSGEIAANAFAGNNLSNVVFGSEVAVIGENAFNGSNSLQNVYSTPSTPPAAQNNSFSYYEGQLWVPEEAIDTYYNTAPCWYRFSGKALVIPEELKVTGLPKLEGKPGETFQLTAELSPANVTLDRILWHSTNPAIATVDNNGLVTLHNFDLSEDSDEVMMALADTETRTVQIIASTLYEDSPMAVVTIDVETLGIEYINSDSQFGNGSNDRPNDIYNLQGVCLKRNASQEDVDALAPGFYIVGGKKVFVK